MGQSSSSKHGHGRTDPFKMAKATGMLSQRNAKLERVPPYLSMLTELKTVDLSHNLLKTLPSQIGCLHRLKTLNISHNLIESLPEEMSQLKELRTLRASHNKLTTISAAVLPRTRLRIVDLSYNELKGVIGHPEVAFPQCVEILDLSHNKIEGLSEAFGFQILRELIEIDLDDNLVETLPDEMKYLPKISTLKCRNNRLKSLPPSLLLETKLDGMELGGNPFTLEDLKQTEGYETFMTRRKSRISRAFNGGVAADISTCGLD